MNRPQIATVLLGSIGTASIVASLWENIFVIPAISALYCLATVLYVISGRRD